MRSYSLAHVGALAAAALTSHTFVAAAGRDTITISEHSVGPGRRKAATGPGRRTALFLNETAAARAERRLARAIRSQGEGRRPLAGHIWANAELARRQFPEA